MCSSFLAIPGGTEAPFPTMVTSVMHTIGFLPFPDLLILIPLPQLTGTTSQKITWNLISLLSESNLRQPHALLENSYSA